MPWCIWLALGIGLAATFVPPAAFPLLHAPWAQIRFELFTYPFRAYPLVRSLPYPPLVSSSVSLATPFGADSLAAAIGGALLLGATALASIRRIPAAGFWAALTFAPDPGRGGGLPTARGLREAAAFLRGAVPADQAIFVGCGRHDRVFVNEPLLYFLAGRRPGSKYHALDPGVVTTLPVQEEIVRGLGEQRVEWVVLSTRFDAWNEPNASSESTGVTRLDDYLRANYAVVSRFPPAIEVRRRATPWEAAPASSQPRAPVGIVGVR